MAKEINSYTHPINEIQVNQLRDILEQENYEFKHKDYAIFSAKKNRLHVTVYEKGPKVLIQGKDTKEFVKFTLEPKILGFAKLDYEDFYDWAHLNPKGSKKVSDFLIEEFQKLSIN